MDIFTSLVSSLNNNDGITFKAGKPITYKTGWQVATHGVEVKTIAEAVSAILAFGGNCGIWFADGIYYVDFSFRVKTKTEALKIGREHNQISVFGWSKAVLAYC